MGDPDRPGRHRARGVGRVRRGPGGAERYLEGQAPQLDHDQARAGTPRQPPGLVSRHLRILLMVSLAVSAALQAFSTYMAGVFPVRELALKVLDFIISIGLMWGMFAAMYKVLPDTPVAWRDVAIGALVTTGLFQRRQVFDRPLHQPERCRLLVRRRRRADRPAGVDLLFVADLLVGCRVHPRLGRDPRQSLRRPKVAPGDTRGFAPEAQPS